MLVRFVRREELAPGIWQYFFRPERPVDFVPGQYCDFHILQPLNDPRGQMRTFTLTSLPDDELMSIVLKHFELQSPYKQALEALQPGEEMRINDAMGDLILPKLASMPLVFVAGGIGIASFVSMLTLLTRQKEQRPIFMFYALRSHREQIFRELVNGYPLGLNQTILAPNRLSAAEIKDSTPPDSLIYLSGSQTFVETLRAELAALGTPHEQTIFDYYDGYAEL